MKGESLDDKFKKRGAKGNHWANLRSCSFLDDFKDEEIYLLNSLEEEIAIVEKSNKGK